MTILRNLNIAASDSPSIGAFGRWRVCNPETLFDSKNIFNDGGIADNAENLPLLWDNQQTSGSGSTTTYRANESSQRLTVATNLAATRVRQTKQSFSYQPGKSQLIYVTFNLISLDSGIRKRVGYFSTNNGLYLETEGSNVYVVRRTSTSGSVENNRVAKASWNIDPMDGTGPSGVTLDLTKTQILAIDFEWLGVGRVRMGFVVDGMVYYVHEFLNANNLTVVYMQSPNQPIRYEITNDGTGAGSSIDCICASVMSEGGVQDRGVNRYLSTSTHVDANAAGTTYAIIGLRLKSAYIGSTIKIFQADLIEVQGSKNLEWTLVLNPTVAGAFTYNDVTNSAVQVAYGATANTVTGGYAVEGGFFASGTGKAAGIAQDEVKNTLNIGAAIDGTVDTIVLCATPLTGSVNADVFGGLAFRELV